MYIDRFGGRHYCPVEIVRDPKARKEIELQTSGTSLVEVILRQLNLLTPEERIEVFSNYCPYCGTNNIPCHCWNDE